MNRLIVLGALLCLGCENLAARRYGGTMTKQLPAGQKLINVTWKENDMWILTRQMKVGEVAEVYSFKQSSDLGVFNGEVLIKESAK